MAIQKIGNHFLKNLILHKNVGFVFLQVGFELRIINAELITGSAPIQYVFAGVIQQPVGVGDHKPRRIGKGNRLRLVEFYFNEAVVVIYHPATGNAVYL